MHFSLIVLTAFSDFEYARKAIELNVEDFLLKPVDPIKLMDKISKITIRLYNQYVVNEHQKSLQNDLDKAVHNGNIKASFFASMSHELRTILNGLLGFINLLKNSDTLFEKDRDYINPNC